MIIEKGKTYMVMGLLDSDSIAYAIGQTIRSLGGRVIFTAQNERMKSIFFDRADKRMAEEEKAALDIRFCDITAEEEVQELFKTCGPIAGVVHSIAYANPKTCLGEEFHTSSIPDVLLSYHISSISLATVLKHCKNAMQDGGSVLALTFDTSRVYPYYNWMGIHKAALEATARSLARRHGRDRIRVNVISAGPLNSKAASKIPGFDQLNRIWEHASPLKWDTDASKQDVANAAAFLLGPMSKKITGQTLYVDGGASIISGELLPFEREGGPAAGPHLA